MSDFTKMMDDYRLTTAEILYHFPDYPRLLQTYIWQELDLPPDFPTLKRFLNFWERKLEGRLHSVKITSCGIITPADVRFAQTEFYLH
ncbi:MAG: Usg family protein [Hyphomicrobiales bacterium]|nr:Usg family protein [Hyphomicrobiales bacterium]